MISCRQNLCCTHPPSPLTQQTPRLAETQNRLLSVARNNRMRIRELHVLSSEVFPSTQINLMLTPLHILFFKKTVYLLFVLAAIGFLADFLCCSLLIHLFWPRSMNRKFFTEPTRQSLSVSFFRHFYFLHFSVGYAVRIEGACISCMFLYG